MDRLQAADLGLLYSLERLHRPWLDDVVRAVTTIGNSIPMALIVALLAGLFAARRQFRLALVMAGIGVAAGGLHIAAKYAIKRPRPDVAWRKIDLPRQSSFPSGHASGSMGVFLGAALLASRRIASRWAAGLLVAAGVTLGLLIGLTRPYLGVHYPSDVLAGWLLGAACALAGYAVARIMEEKKFPPDDVNTQVPA